MNGKPVLQMAEATGRSATRMGRPSRKAPPPRTAVNVSPPSSGAWTAPATGRPASTSATDTPDHREAVEEVGRPVEGVDHPPQVAPGAAALLAEEGDAGGVALERLPDRLLAGQVDLADVVARRLRVHPGRQPPEVLGHHPAPEPGRRLRHRPQPGQLRQPRATTGAAGVASSPTGSRTAPHGRGWAGRPAVPPAARGCRRPGAGGGRRDRPPPAPGRRRRPARRRPPGRSAGRRGSPRGRARRRRRPARPAPRRPRRTGSAPPTPAPGTASTAASGPAGRTASPRRPPPARPCPGRSAPRRAGLPPPGRRWWPPRWPG